MILVIDIGIQYEMHTLVVRFYTSILIQHITFCILNYSQKPSLVKGQTFRHLKQILLETQLNIGT